MKFLPALMLMSLISLPGCAPITGVPSLAARPYEITATTPVETELPREQRGPDGILAQKIALLLQQARDGEQAFGRSEQETVPVIFAGNRAAEGTDAWIAGETARSALEAARRPASDALTALSDLLVEKVQASADYPIVDAIKSALSQAETISARQSTRLEQLRR